MKVIVFSPFRVSLFSARCHISQNRKFLWLFCSLAVEICMWTCALDSAMKLFWEGWKRNAYKRVQLKSGFVLTTFHPAPPLRLLSSSAVHGCPTVMYTTVCSTALPINISAVVFTDLYCGCTVVWLLVVAFPKNFWPDALHFAYGLLNPKLMTAHSVFYRCNDQSWVHLFFLFAHFSLVWGFSTEADLSFQLQ